jgi:hypothetical protein
MKLSLTGTDTWSKLLLAAPDGKTMSGLWWALTSGSLWLVAIALPVSGQWVGVLFFPAAAWSACRAIAQARRGKLLS